MKRFIVYGFALLFGVCLLSCDESDGGKGKQMKPDEQKSYLENVIIEFTQKTSSSDFLDLKGFAMDLAEIYEDYNWSKVENNMEAGLDSCSVLTDEDSRTYSYSNWTDYYYYYYYDVTLTLSNFTGHYTASNGTWRYTAADDLQFDFQDAEGKNCVLKLTKSGKETTLRLPASENRRYSDYDTDYSGSTPYYYFHFKF